MKKYNSPESLLDILCIFAIIKICKAYYWQIEHNNSRLQYQLAKEIAAIFHLKPDDIFYDETN